jgi:hypothetical protein
MSWFHELPSTTLAILVVTFTIVVSIGGLALTVGWVRRTDVHQQLDNGTIVGLLAALIGIYAIAAGLTAVAVWSNAVDASANVDREAAQITVLYADFSGYPEPLQTQLKRGLGEYTRYVIEKEWPYHERGVIPPGLLDMLERAERTLFQFEPTTEGQKIMHAEVLRTFNRMIELRRLRLQSVENTALPGALWMVVILLGVIAISTCYMLRLDNFRLHATVTTLVAMPIALILYFIAVTDRPFQGGVNVSPAPYRMVLEQIIVPDLARRQ